MHSEDPGDMVDTWHAYARRPKHMQGGGAVTAVVGAQPQAFPATTCSLGMIPRRQWEGTDDPGRSGLWP